MKKNGSEDAGFLEFFKNKRILITGAAGTIGKAIVRMLLKFHPKELILIDNNETDVFFLMKELENSPQKVTCFLGDIRDRDRIEKIAKGIDYIFHAAAFKHVMLSEYNPFDVIQTNVLGVQNIIWAVINNNIKNVLFMSSDKAVNPTNVMGTTKLLGEKMMTAANSIRYGDSTIFSSTRFGNVMGSKGSVVPVFIKQIRNGGPISITDIRMTRFIMTIDEATRLVLKSMIISKGGEVFITKMPVVRIIDLAKAMIDILAPKYGINKKDLKIECIGAGPGEKLYEELMTEDEIHRLMETKDMFATLPPLKSVYNKILYKYPNTIKKSLKKPYISSNEKYLSEEEIKDYLLKNKVLEKVEAEIWGEI